jgi:hypothetical protein
VTNINEPDSVKSWNRADRRARAVSHHRSSNGQGPAHATIGSTDLALGRLMVAGTALTAPLPVTHTGRPSLSSTSIGIGCG